MIVKENINFERGLDPFKSMDIGITRWQNIGDGAVLEVIKNFYYIDGKITNKSFGQLVEKGSILDVREAEIGRDYTIFFDYYQSWESYIENKDKNQTWRSEYLTGTISQLKSRMRIIQRSELAELLKEGKIEDINREDIISPDFQKNMNAYVHNEDDYVYAFKEMFHKEDLDDDEILDSKEFKEMINNELEKKYEDLLETLYWLPEDDGKIKIWRIITTNDKDFLNKFKSQGKHLGIYWAFDEKAAEPHWGYGKDINVKFECRIDENNVDWLDTIKVNLTLQEEKEIRLFKNTPLTLDKLWIDSVEQNIEDIKKNKTFLS